MVSIWRYNTEMTRLCYSNSREFTERNIIAARIIKLTN